MATPDAIQDIYAREVVSGFDLHKPEIQNELFRRFGNQGVGYFQTLRTMGFETPSANETYGHFEENRIHESFQVRSNVSDPGVGADADVTLHLDDLDASNRFYPRKYDQVLFPNEVVGYIADIDVSTPAAPVLTIRPNDDTDNIGALAADTTLIISSNNWSEASGQPTPAFSGSWFYDNDAQIIKETIEYTGTEMTMQDWVKMDSDGNGIPAWYYKGQNDIDYRMSLRLDGALLFSKRTTNAAAIDPDTGNKILSTEGVVPFIRRKGHEYPVATGAFAVTDFDAIDRLLDQEGVGPTTLTMNGIKRSQNIENVLKEYFNDTNIQWAKDTVNELYFGGVDSKAASVNLKYLVKSERTFMFQRMRNFNNIKTYGADGYGMPDMSLFLPLGKVKDPKTKKLGTNLGVRYRALGPYNRRTEIWQVGGAGPSLKVTEFDKTSTYQRSHVGAHNRGGNQMLLVHV